MRILFSLLDAQVGGGQRVAHSIAQELSWRSHEIGVMAPEDGPAVSMFAELGAALHRVDIGTLRRSAEAPKATAAVRGYDILYSHTSIPGQILGDLAARTVSRVHVAHQHTVPRISPSLAVGLGHRVLYRATVARRTIIAVAPHVRRAVLALGARPGLAHVVPNGVDVDHLHAIAVSVPRHEGVRVGVLARFDPQKGLDPFLAAAASLRDVEASFVIGASGNAYPEHEIKVRARARELSVGVVDLGNDGAGFLADLDIVVMPSLRAEGLPLTLLEAMGMGKAIVASDIDGIGTLPGISEAVELVPPDDATAVALAVQGLIEDPERRKAVGARAVELVRARYRVSDAARAAADIVERATI
jgi:glycosyltransferase involved in cell wall biosynthesis